MRKVVIDANRILSAVLRDGSTREAILRTEAALFAPEMLREEIDRHLPEIAGRAAVQFHELATILAALLKRIEWVPEPTYRPHMATAKRALGRIDPTDVPYLACALAVGADAIWTFDLDFDKQALVPRIPHPDAKLK